jgi:hypothetical protein
MAIPDRGKSTFASKLFFTGKMCIEGPTWLWLLMSNVKMNMICADWTCRVNERFGRVFQGCVSRPDLTKKGLAEIVVSFGLSVNKHIEYPPCPLALARTA